MKQRLTKKTKNSNNKTIMKKITNLLTVAAFLSCLNFINCTASAQGSLTPPPGAPKPVMKSLDQVEARTPLIPGAPGVTYTNGLYTITQPGSYYLTENLTRTNGTWADFIFLATNNVTLDLNGFTLFGTTGNKGNAISGSGTGYRISNGYIVGGTTQTNGVFTEAGFNAGIEIYFQNVNEEGNCIVSDIVVRGVRYTGILLGHNSVVERCLVDTAAGQGIFAGAVRDSRAINTKSDAIVGSSIMNCVGKCVGTGWGITSHPWETSDVQNSIGEAVSGIGLSGISVMNCRGISVSGIGLSATTAMNSSGESTTGTALSASIANSCTGRRPNGTAISATIGIGCRAIYGTNQIVNKYNMP